MLVNTVKIIENYERVVLFHVNDVCKLGWVHIGIGMCVRIHEADKKDNKNIFGKKIKINDFYKYILRFSLLKNRFEK